MQKHSASVVGPDPDGLYWITLEAGEIRASVPVRGTGIVWQVMAAFTGQPALVEPHAVELPAIKQDDLLACLQQVIDRAEHQPGDWVEGLGAGGSIGCLSAKFPTDEIGRLGHRRDALLAVAAVNALPELMQRAQGAEKGERAADQEVERLYAKLEHVRKQRSGQAEAWLAVFNTLIECVPGWTEFDQHLTTTEMACNTIRRLAKDADAYRRLSSAASSISIEVVEGEPAAVRDVLAKRRDVTQG